MKFSDFNYHRPEIEQLKKDFKQHLDALEAATDFNIQNSSMQKIIDLRNNFETQMSIASVRYTQDTTNKEFQDEQDFFDENSPVYNGLVTDFYKSILNSRFRIELEQKWGKQLFSIAEMTSKTFSPEVLEDLKKENQLVSEYTKLLASAKILFEGKDRNLSEIEPFLSSVSRETRKKAQEAKYSFFIENTEQFDGLFDQLVKLRHQIARKLGFKNFVELGYCRMLRGDYNAQMVADYRKQIQQFIVPLVSKLRDKQVSRLKVDDLYYYDEPLYFKTGNADPKGSADWIVERAKKMYAELSPETDEFFNFMVKNELLDLEVRKGKATGGYCTIFNDYRSPFIFSNFNGTTHDIIVLTHEAGHAFQVYSSRNYGIPEYFFPTFEACEIHSMSMEFLTWPWMDLFFLEDTDKFKFAHISKALFFLPYGVAVDEFQHFIYENPELTPKERNKGWREIEKKYVPTRMYIDNDYLEMGGFWQQQRHIYASPFYYIDYTLAQTCAFQFWQKANENRENALKDYVKLCKEGGSKSFLELVEIANLKSPFEGGCVESVVGDIEKWIDQVDTQSF